MPPDRVPPELAAPMSVQRGLTLSRALARSAADALALDPERVLAAAAARLRAFPGGPNQAVYNSIWRAAIGSGADTVIRVLLDDSELADVLRSMSPFIDAVSAEERDRIYAQLR